MKTIRYTVTFEYDGPAVSKGAMEEYLIYWLHENGHFPRKLNLEAEFVLPENRESTGD